MCFCYTTSFRQMALEYGSVFFLPYSFLVANQRLYKQLYLSVRRSVHQRTGRDVRVRLWCRTKDGAGLSLP